MNTSKATTFAFFSTSLLVISNHFCTSSFIVPTSLSPNQKLKQLLPQRSTHPFIVLFAETEKEEEPKLIIGSEAEASLEDLKSKYPTNEAGFLAAAKKRSEEAKKRMTEQAALEEEEEEDPKESSSVDFGPADFSEYRFVEDGFEASAGNDGTMAPVLSTEEKKKAEGEEEEEPSLLLFDKDDDEPTLLI